MSEASSRYRAHLLLLVCPECHRGAFRFQPSGPPGQARRGPYLAYPCLCWITAEAAMRAAQRKGATRVDVNG